MIDLRLYVVTDPLFLEPGRLVEACVEAVRGGATLVQLRDKAADDATLLRQAVELRGALAPHGVAVIVNDRVEVARAAGLGVHLGVDDASPAAARNALGPDAVIGWSVESPDQLEDEAQLAACSYLAASPVWVTPTKTDTAAPLGPRGVAALRRHTVLPLVGIGGITTSERAADVIAAGADGVAVVSAVFGGGEPRRAAAALRAAVDGALVRSEDSR